jgi:simple sugar transport system ATP-binding protein
MKDVHLGRGLVSASLTLHAGEIVGIAGVSGNGQRQLVDLLAGDVQPTSGSLVIGKTAIVREDRQGEGLVLDASLRDNVLLGEFDRFSHWGVLDTGALEREARARVLRSGALASVAGRSAEELSAAAIDRPARSLSGGNQQKLVVIRALARDAKVIVAEQPTRGVDLAASADIHAELVGAAERGAGVLVLSADLDELRKLASRILVLAGGRFVAEFPPTASDDEIGRSMLGVNDPAHVVEDHQADRRRGAS